MVSDHPLVDALQAEYDEAFRMFRDAVQRLDDEQWGLGRPTWTEVPARTARHTLLCAAFYIAPSREGFDWQPDGQKYWECPVEALPGRQATLEEIDRIAGATRDYLAGHSDDELCTRLAAASRGKTRVHWMIYALRHLTHHVAQLSGQCKQRGLAAAAWE